MKQKYMLGIVVLSLVVILGVGMVSAFGKEFMNHNITEEERTEMQEQQKAMQTAILDGDYETWKSLMEEEIAKMQAQITEKKFNTIREQHQEMLEFRTAMQEARKSGDFSKIEELQEEYGFEGKGFGRGIKSELKIGRGNCPFAE